MQSASTVYQEVLMVPCMPSAKRFRIACVAQNLVMNHAKLIRLALDGMTYCLEYIEPNNQHIVKLTFDDTGYLDCGYVQQDPDPLLVTLIDFTHVKYSINAKKTEEVA